MKGKDRSSTRFFAPAAFLAACGFFGLALPYHLMRREQLDLFVYDGDYICQTYRGTGWLARLCGDFLEQFFHLPFTGPVLVALLLTGIGVVAYRISRKFLGRWPSLGIAAAFFLWSFFRETGGFHLTRYTVAVLGYLSLVLLALQARRAWLRPVAAVLLLAAGAWALGSPFHKEYGRAWNFPDFRLERVFGLDAEVARERWDRVLALSREDLSVEEASYCYNLAQAMQGALGDKLLDFPQNHHYTLLFPVSSDRSIFTNSLAGEAWFHLGDLTVAEQSAITSLQASPKHTGARYLVRLARVNLISGEEAAAQKYLDLLSKTLFYGKWARSMMPGRQDEATRAQLAKARARLVRKDFVHHSDVPRSVLLDLLGQDPTNRIARNYLLCFDLMRYDLEEFIVDYVPDMIPARIYHEAILIWLSQHDILNAEQLARYGVDVSTVDRMNRFGRAPGSYKNTYWYYYLQAMNAQ